MDNFYFLSEFIWGRVRSSTKSTQNVISSLINASNILFILVCASCFFYPCLRAYNIGDADLNLSRRPLTMYVLCTSFWLCDFIHMEKNKQVQFWVYYLYFLVMFCFAQDGHILKCIQSSQGRDTSPYLQDSWAWYRVKAKIYMSKIHKLYESNCSHTQDPSPCFTTFRLDTAIDFNIITN